MWIMEFENISNYLVLWNTVIKNSLNTKNILKKKMALCSWKAVL